MARTTVVVRARQRAGRSTAAVIGLSKPIGSRTQRAAPEMVQWQSRKTLFSPRPFSLEGKRRVRAHPEPMDTEGMSFGACFALAGSVVAVAWKNAGRSIHKRRATEERPLNCVEAPAQSIAHCKTSAVASYVLAKAQSVQGSFLLSD
jgi:hypothetical protein